MRHDFINRNKTDFMHFIGVIPREQSYSLAPLLISRAPSLLHFLPFNNIYTDRILIHYFFFTLTLCFLP